MTAIATLVEPPPDAWWLECKHCGASAWYGPYRSWMHCQWCGKKNWPPRTTTKDER